MSSASRRLGSLQIKICGITNLSDAMAAIECGADALGFNLFEGSKRFIDFESTSQWIRQLPSGTGKVAVLVNPTLEHALAITRSMLFDSLQLHGNESPEFCRMLAENGATFIKALPIADETSLDQPAIFSTRNVLLDSSTARGFGGTGQTFPWSLAKRFIEAHPELRVLLAGGLTPENVAEAIRMARPAGVDVTSGVEAGFGRKDRDRLRAFISAARSA